LTDGPVVCNASPLIALAQIGQLALLEQLFGTVVVPPAVIRETAPSVSPPTWVEERPLAQPIGPRILRASLGPGESETISLALELGARWVILDDRPARRLARGLQLNVIGTLGILLAARKRDLLPAVRPCLDALLQHDFFIAPALYEQVLREAGEAP